MMKLLTFLTLCLLPIGFAAAAAPNFDVPEQAKWEALRRGNLVQEIGVQRESITDVIGAALATPEDDSHKWYLTLVTTSGCRACDKLKYDLAHEEQLQAWVNVGQSSKSPLHYQVRRLEDPTQRDWLKAIRPQLDKGGYPAIVLQPPRNGEFGHGATTVAILHGYDGDPAALAERLRRAITTYVREYSAQQASRSGHRQDAEANPIGGPPPFAIPSTPLDPNQPGAPVDWPAVINPRPLTPQQIQQLVPQAPPEFILTVLQSQTSEPSQLLQQWQLYQLQQQQQQQQQVAPQQPAEAPSGGGFWAMVASLLGGGTLTGVVTLAVMILKKLSSDKEIRDKVNELLNR